VTLHQLFQLHLFFILQDSKQSVEFRDKDGKIILKKFQRVNSPGSGHIGWLCTYYIYDDLGNLRYVLPPKCVELLLVAGNWTISSALRDELCFYSGYDNRNRMNVKKVPGVGEVYFVYDSRDRLCMTQDSNLRASSKWLITSYDALNRPVKTALINNSIISSRTFTQHRTNADTTIDYPFNVFFTPGSGYELLTETGYDSYDSIPSASGVSGTLVTINITSTNFLNTYNAYPNYAQEVTQSKAIRGLVTWTKVKVLGTNSDFLYTACIYDDRTRLIQLKANNISGGIDIMTSQYDFTGKVLRSHMVHQKNGTNSATHALLTKKDYDQLGRLLNIHKKLDNSAETNVVSNKYDALGQLNKKYLGYLKSGPTSYTTMPIDSFTYDYNIRGWILGMNRSYVKSTTSTSNYFGFDLGYNRDSFLINGSPKLYTSKQYNGNISGMLWKSIGDGEVRKYDFSYDAVGRLTDATFKQFSNNAFNINDGIDFSVNNMTYDPNGNIQTMIQKGWKLGGSVTVDSLYYNYYANSNKLLNVIDEVNDTATRLGDFRSSKKYMDDISTKSVSTEDYAYDGNGSMLKDLNKDISSIDYNYLNLPETIFVAGKGRISFTYDALGNKLKKEVIEGETEQVLSSTLYMVGIYINDTLQFFSHEEGRMRSSSSNIADYDYFVKDHLGNVRMVLTDELKTDMYPAASMEELNEPSDISDPANYIPFYSNTDYTYNEDFRYSVGSISDYPWDDYIEPNEYVAKLQADSVGKIGPGIALKVMAGDKFNVRVSSWYKTNNESPEAPQPLNSLLEALIGSFSPIAATKGIRYAQLSTSSNLQQAVQDFFAAQSYDIDKPKAYLNWILFDEQFNFVQASSGADQVPIEDEYNNASAPDNNVYLHMFDNLPITKNGYLYVYVSNETPNIPVYFDNLQVTHIRGPILEETHYYPFGLIQSGISSRALNFGGSKNKKKFNGIEHTDEFELNQYDAFFRTLDPQIGRWHTVDPKPNEFESPYVAMGNNPIFKFDPLGDTVKNRTEADNAAIIAWIAEGLGLKQGQSNPFHFNKNGELQVNNKKFNKLNADQKKIGQNVVEAINAPALLEVQLVDENDIIDSKTVQLNKAKGETEVIVSGKSYKDGDKINKTINDYGGGRTKPPVLNGNGPGSDYILTQIIRQNNSETVAGRNGTQISSPNFIVIFHEAFGHAVYHYMQQNNATQNQQTINYENSIRKFRGLPERSGTDHPQSP
jgi:RHS repeat-associated protein